ncbi:MAG: transglutaminase-like domain-containing protein [Verrucomicrobiota bacterium]|nr:transglutaminase-like domain-containing protein [Verrucomicrobiota bacterium]
MKGLVWAVPFLMMLQNKHRSTHSLGDAGLEKPLTSTLMGLLDAVDLRQVGQVLQKHEDLTNLTQVNNPDQGVRGKGQSVDAYTTTIRDIDDRIGKMIRVIQAGKRDPRIRERVAKIVQNLPEKDDGAEIKAIFNYVREKVRFTSDIHNIETYQDPVTTLDRFGIGDCDDYVIALASMYLNIGFPVRIKVSADTSTHPTQSEPQWNHVWLQVGVPKINPTQWIDVDASVDRPLGWWIGKEREIKHTKIWEVE